MKSPSALLISLALVLVLVNAQDWNYLGTPNVFPGAGNEWVINWDISDSFNYNSKGAAFNRKWVDFNPTEWTGPGATLFSRGNSFLNNGMLNLKVSSIPPSQRGAKVCTHPPGRTPGRNCECNGCFLTAKRVRTGFVRSKASVKFPVYVEAMIKGTRTPLASAFWLRSDQTEIDIQEMYGDTDRSRKKVGMNIHFFKRGGGDIQYPVAHQSGIDMTRTFVRLGVQWMGPKLVHYYLNGVRIRTIDATNIVRNARDPTGKYFNETMHIIMSQAAHRHRGEEGIPTDLQMNNNDINKVQIKWIRVYEGKPKRR